MSSQGTSTELTSKSQLQDVEFPRPSTSMPQLTALERNERELAAQGQSIREIQSILRVLLAAQSNQQPTDSNYRPATLSDERQGPTSRASFTPNGTITVIPEGSLNSIQPIIQGGLWLLDPPKYSGSRRDNACDFWAKEMYSYFRRFEQLYEKTPTEVQRIAFVTQYLEGDARMWWIIEEAHFYAGISTNPLPKTTKEFFDRLRANFGDLNSSQRSWDK